MGVSVPESSGAPRPGLIRPKRVSVSERGLVSTERLLPEWPIPGRLPPGEGVFSWGKGDILLLDNMSIAHGREPYAGERKIVVAMSEPCSDDDLRPEGGPH